MRLEVSFRRPLGPRPSRPLSEAAFRTAVTSCATHPEQRGVRRAPSHSEEASRAHTGPGPGLAVFLPCLSFSVFMPPYRFLHQTRLCVFLNPVSHCCWNRALGPRAAAAFGRENGRALHPTPDLPGVWSGSGCPHRPTRLKRGHPAVHAVLSSAVAAVRPPPSTVLTTT